ncbi:RNA polymerase sigma factor [Maribacter sp. 2-571]|uniref:RNA polymerase sigma factor n=1 Tax=Maribacter sp. 2-571 TaxID=3417569 RepID=UPI003D34ED34
MNYENPSHLLEALTKGEESAFIFLVDRYSQRLFAYAITLTNDEAMAQDILQNVFLRTWEHRKRMQVVVTLQNYLFKSVHNEFLNQYKRNRSKMVLEQKYFSALNNAAKSHDETSFAKVIEHIGKEIQQLPPKCKEVFLLSRKEGLTNIEIANYLNVSKKTVEAHVTKAFSILRKRLGDRVEVFLCLVFATPSVADR